MKRLILLLILFVNLQIVITHEDMRLFSYSTASAQHMTKEAGDNCQDPVDKLWYRFPFSDCEEVIVTPDGIQIECPYCHEQFTDFDSFVNHDCHRDNMPNGESGGSGGSGSGNTGGGGGSGSGGSSGGGGGNGGGASASSNQTNSSTFPVPKHIPVGRPAAAMAGYSYHDKLQDFYEDETGEWEVDEHEKTRFESHGVNFEIPLIGLKSELFVTMNTRKEITGYVVSFAGTDSFKDNLAAFLIDAYNDAINLKDIPSPQYMALYNFVKKVEELVGDKPLTFVGHSLGGGLASLASILTGRPAIVFNPAAVAESYVTALELMGKSHGTSNIYGYIMEWDYVTIGQACFGVLAPGNFKIVKNMTGGDPHAIETMVENLK